jgi:hypothetical protein
MRSFTPIYLLLLFMALAASPAVAQEKRVPFDSTGQVDEIDADLEARLALFPHYTSFKWAKLYRLPDSTYALDIRHATPGFTVVTRTALSPTEAATLRSRVEEGMRKFFPAPPPVAAATTIYDSAREGREILVSGTTLNALFLYGVAVPVMLGTDIGTSIPIYGATAVAGYAIPRLLTRNSNISPGAARLAVGGATIGFLQGGLVNDIVNGRKATFEGFMGWGTGVSIATEIGGYYLGKHLGISEGRAEITTVGGMLGFGIGVTAAGIADLYGPSKTSARGTVMLIGSQLGYIGGYALGGSGRYTVGDARVVFASGVIGAYVPLVVIALIQADTPPALLLAPIAGSVAGVGLGHMLVGMKDFSTSQGTLVVVGTVGGMVVGFLGGLAVTPERRDYDKLYGAVAGSAIGGLAGYTVFMTSISGSAEEGKIGSLINIRLAPEGAATFALRDRLHLPESTTFPLLQVEGRF